MKSASDYAVEAHYGDGHQKGCSPCCAVEIDLIKKALTEFAEERVKEAKREVALAHQIIDGVAEVSKNIQEVAKEARNAALDEAANVVIVHEGGLCNCHDDPEKCHQFKIDEIRALKK